MGNAYDVRCNAADLYFLPVETRVPLKFGTETLTAVTCARVCLRVQDRAGRSASGWGETPLSVQWVWPSSLTYEERYQAMRAFCTARLTRFSIIRGPNNASSAAAMVPYIPMEG